MRRRWQAFRSATGAWTIDILRRPVFRLRFRRHRGPAEKRSRAAPAPARRRAASSTACRSRPITPRAPRRRRKPKPSTWCLSNGNIREYGIDPAPPVDPDRLPITDAHRRGVFDPMTARCCARPPASIRSAPRSAAVALRSSTAAMRYDLKLDFKAHGNGSGGEGLSRPRRWSARFISRRSRATSPTAR